MSKSYISKYLKEATINRARQYCEYCLLPADFSPAPFCIDHIISEALGGLTELENLAYACGGCNGYKHDKISVLDSKSQKEITLYNPRIDIWTEHFYWNTDDTIMVGKTDKGRATIELLKVNRPQNINLRALLRLIGVHPPTDYP
jgi:hypothetical protein